MKKRLHLYWRLAKLVPRALMAVTGALPRLEYRRWRSEVESIHRDLGHDYDADVILREHER